MNTEKNDNVSRLPLWENCLDQLIASGLKYGDEIPVHYFAERLKCEPGTMEFDLGVSQIRRALEGRGMYLNGRGNRGEFFNILDPAKNAGVMSDYGRRASDALKRGITLGVNTDTSQLTDSQRAVHEKAVGKMQIKLAMISRPAAFLSALGQRARARLKI